MSQMHVNTKESHQLDINGGMAQAGFSLGSLHKHTLLDKLIHRLTGASRPVTTKTQAAVSIKLFAISNMSTEQQKAYN